MAALIAVQCGNIQNLWMLNSVFLTLIPKKKAADQVKDFRPISLIHSFAKLVTKILANRLARKLHDLVANNQNVFIKGRCIQDNFMLVQQTADRPVLSPTKTPSHSSQAGYNEGFRLCVMAFSVGGVKASRFRRYMVQYHQRHPFLLFHEDST